MINLSGMISLALLKKETFTGSERGMRFRLAKVSDEAEGDRLEAVVWPEPFQFSATEEEKKERAYFSFSQEGLTEAVAWMNERHSTEPEKWKKKKKEQA
ncbi:MAG: hypothetical protein Q4D90_09385 [bacterium]|nr:hypothetical protein [bacterium]